MMKVGVISDTHGLLRQEVLEILRSCDCILHAGDINNQGILEELGRIAPAYVVRGNNDKEWAEHLPHDLTVQLEGLKIFMVQQKGNPKHASGCRQCYFRPFPQVF